MPQHDTLFLDTDTTIRQKYKRRKITKVPHVEEDDLHDEIRRLKVREVIDSLVLRP